VKTYINGLLDMKTIIQNERKVGGAVEAELIKLRTGEEYSLPVKNIPYRSLQELIQME